MIPPSSLNNYFNHPDGARFHCPTWILQERGCISRLPEFLIPGLPQHLVIDHALTPQRLPASLNPVSVTTVSGEPDTTQVSDLLDHIATGPINLIAFGGGSAIDAAKAAWAHQSFGAWQQLGYGNLRLVSDTPPPRPGRFIAIPSTAASGSEVSRYFLIKDNEGRKQVGRSWSVTPDIALLDPDILQSLPIQSLIAGAFDAFSHAWETYHCAQEGSPFIRLLAENAISSIIRALERLNEKGTDTEVLTTLQMAATLGGICLSNVRTGMLHTCGEALAAQISLAHPESLFIFLEEVLNTYTACSPLARKLNFEPSVYWKAIWQKHGLTVQLLEKTMNHPISMKHLADSVAKDRVLIDKEHPTRLSEQEIEQVLARALSTFNFDVS